MKENRYIVNGKKGIAITIYGEIYEKYKYNRDCILIKDRLWLAFNENNIEKYDLDVFTKIDKANIKTGISIVADDILNKIDNNKQFVVEISDLLYGLCYYQEEAMVAAMMDWCAKWFDFERRHVEKIFDNEKNKYVFEITDELNKNVLPERLGYKDILNNKDIII